VSDYSAAFDSKESKLVGLGLWRLSWVRRSAVVNPCSGIEASTVEDMDSRVGLCSRKAMEKCGIA
jgi:hypothetical protein